MDILNIRRKGAGNLTEEDVTEASRIIDKISKEEEGFDAEFHKAQADYAKKHKMKLMDNKMQKEIDKLNNE